MNETWEEKLKRLEILLETEPNLLTEEDKAFLKARATYLGKRLTKILNEL
jgi:hypothetical protein